MTGSLQHLGGDRWRVRVYSGQSVTGRSRTLSRSFRAPTERAAKKASAGHILALQHLLDEASEARGTVGELADRWLTLKRRDKSPSTVAGYQTHVTAIKAAFGRLPVDRLTGRKIDDWYEQMIGRGMSPATIGHYHASLRGMLRLGERYGEVISVATRAASPPTVDHFEISPPTTAALAVLMQSARGDLAVALRVLAACGVRRGELVGLRWTDLTGSTVRVERSVLELKGGVLHVKTPKSRRSREISVDADTLAVLAVHRAALRDRAAQLGAVLADDAYVFADLRSDPRGGIPRRPGWLSQEWARLRARHGSRVRLHDVRHWHATTLIDQGVPIPTVSKRLGHARVHTTLDVYSHAVAGSDTAAANTIGLALESPRAVGA